jgi:DedD protein
MRESGRWQDKVELSLDNRQIYFLFFGAAVAACLVFTVGVLVGKRLESGAGVSLAHADPLAALDRLGAAAVREDEGLTFHGALAGERRAPQDPLADHERPREAAARSAAPGPKEAKPVPAPAAAPRNGKAPAAAAGSRERRTATGRPEDPEEPAGRAERERYILQLAPLQEQGEAEAVVRRLSASGYRPYLVTSNVPGKGVTYRVRLGEYASRQSAESAKAQFEQKERGAAFVARVR